MTIASVEAVLLSRPLSKAKKNAVYTTSSRECLLVRVRTDDGQMGHR